MTVWMDRRRIEDTVHAIAAALATDSRGDRSDAYGILRDFVGKCAAEAVAEAVAVLDNKWKAAFAALDGDWKAAFAALDDGWKAALERSTNECDESLDHVIRNWLAPDRQRPFDHECRGCVDVRRLLGSRPPS